MNYDIIDLEKKKELIKKLKEFCPNGDPRFYEIIADLGILHSAKNSDYASKEEPLRNFTTVGKAMEEYGIITPGNSATKTALMYAYKQWDAALKLLGRNEKGNIEGITDRLNDIAVYAIIARILYERCQ